MLFRSVNDDFLFTEQDDIDADIRKQIDPIPRLLDQFLQSDKATAGVSSVLKKLNELYGETPDNPADEPVGTIMNKVVRSIDEAAFRIGGQSSVQVRTPKEIQAGIAGDSTTGYTGMRDLSRPVRPDNINEAPNLLRIYLGLDENTLEPSVDAPTDFTKGTPKGGWRSIKKFSREPRFSPALTDDFKNRFKDMDKHVRAGDYVPSRDVISSGEVSWLPADVKSDVDLGGFTQSIGYDKENEQYYLSVTDIWNFDAESYAKKWSFTDGEPNKLVRGQARLMDAVGEGIGIYDRYYIPEDIIEKWRKLPEDD